VVAASAGFPWLMMGVMGLGQNLAAYRACLGQTMPHLRRAVEHMRQTWQAQLASYHSKYRVSVPVSHAASPTSTAQVTANTSACAVPAQWSRAGSRKYIWRVESATQAESLAAHAPRVPWFPLTCAQCASTLQGDCHKNISVG
jgi:hypothetical protein